MRVRVAPMPRDVVTLLCEEADSEDDRHNDEYQQGHHDRRDKPHHHDLGSAALGAFNARHAANSS